MQERFGTIFENVKKRHICSRQARNYEDDQKINGNICVYLVFVVSIRQFFAQIQRRLSAEYSDLSVYPFTQQLQFYGAAGLELVTPLKTETE
jgi:hypothetical protein